jgi:hypothetical protein
MPYRLGCWRCPNTRNKMFFNSFYDWMLAAVLCLRQTVTYRIVFTLHILLLCYCFMLSHQVSCQYRDCVTSMMRWIMNLEHLMDENWQGKPKYSQKTSPNVTLSNTKPTWSDLGSNPGLGYGNPATSHLSSDNVHYLLWRIDTLLGN